ncbi:MAG: hypothetical protein R8M46_04420 [Ghiorsea sp.]
MRIVCPECHAAYQVGSLIKNAILVCHRCDTEFDTFGNKIVEDNETSKIFEQQEAHAPTFGLHDLIHAGMKGRREYLLAWMIIILVLLSATGIAMRWQHWQFSGVVRAFNIETEPATLILDRDWRVLPETIHTQWLTRDDQSLALVVDGQVENLVSIALPTPEIRITFVTQTGQNIVRTLPITEPTDIKSLQAVPFTSPPVDNTPIPSLGKRGFLLLIEDAPQSTQHILIHALAKQRNKRSQL